MYNYYVQLWGDTPRITFIGNHTEPEPLGGKRLSEPPGEAEASDAASGWNPAGSKRQRKANIRTDLRPTDTETGNQ